MLTQGRKDVTVDYKECESCWLLTFAHLTFWYVTEIIMRRLGTSDPWEWLQLQIEPWWQRSAVSILSMWWRESWTRRATSSAMACFCWFSSVADACWSPTLQVDHIFHYFWTTRDNSFERRMKFLIDLEISTYHTVLKGTCTTKT